MQMVYFLLYLGGYPGQRGLNLLHRDDGRVISLGPKTAVDVYPGVSNLKFYFRIILFIAGNHFIIFKKQKVSKSLKHDLL